MTSETGFLSEAKGLLSGMLMLALFVSWWWAFSWWPLSEIGDTKFVLVSCTKANPYANGYCSNGHIVKEGLVVFKALPERQTLVIQKLPEEAPSTVEGCSVRNEENWNCPDIGLQMVNGEVKSNYDGNVYWSLTRYRLCAELGLNRLCPLVNTWRPQRN